MQSTFLGSEIIVFKYRLFIKYLNIVSEIYIYIFNVLENFINLIKSTLIFPTVFIEECKESL